MKAVQFDHFGASGVVQCRPDVARPEPASGEVLVRVRAAGVGPWDALIRSGRTPMVTAAMLPVTLGSDLSGVVESVGSGVDGFRRGDAVFGVTNERFIGAQAEYALAQAGRIAARPARLSDVEAASMPVVAVTAAQMLFRHAALRPGQSILITGAGGAVGGYAIQMARRHGVHILALSRHRDGARLRALGADTVLDPLREAWVGVGGPVDAVIDLAGGALQSQALQAIKPGGVLVSVASPLDPAQAAAARVTARFFYVDVDTAALQDLVDRIEARELQPNVGAVLPIEEARAAHEMLDGERPRVGGKMVLTVGG